MVEVSTSLLLQTVYVSAGPQPPTLNSYYNFSLNLFVFLFKVGFGFNL